jgi:hypothetical protein
MRLNRRSPFLNATSKLVAIAVAVAVLGCAAQVSAQALTPMYSFESPGDLEGFIVNSDFPGYFSTLELNTDPNFASQGTQSLKWVLTHEAYFEGAQTSTVDPSVFADPQGVDFIRFDLINTNRLVPDEPVPGEDPTFADMSVNVFGEFTDEPGVAANIQFLGSQVGVGDLEPGTHAIDVDVTKGGLLVGTSTVKGLNAFIADGLTVFGFQIYLNKSSTFEVDPAFAWTVYLDNVRAGRNVAGLQGDYNGNNTIDAADYTLWRNAFPGGPLVNDDDGIADEGDYTFWKLHFGETGGGGGAGLGAAVVPEPSSLLLVILGGFCFRRLRVRKHLP